MTSMPYLTASLGASLAGFFALSLAMDRHFEGSYGRGNRPEKLRPWLSAAGVFGLVYSLLMSLALQGAAQGWVLWLGVLTVAAIAAVLVLTYAPQHAARVAAVSGAVSLLAPLALLAG